MKTVYTCFCTDVIHEGHLNIIDNAKKYGNVIVGILSDAAMIRFNRFPTIGFEERKRMVESLEGVKCVVVQDDVLYDNIINQLKPDYVIHGDNWQTGPMEAIRRNVLENLVKYGGELIEIPYTYSDNIRRIEKRLKEKLAMPEFRRKRLKQLLKIRSIVKAIEEIGRASCRERV